MNGKKQTKSENFKISEMLIKVTEEYLNMGESREEKEYLLATACSAWNFACEKNQKKREKLIKNYIKDYMEINKIEDANDKILEENIWLLIKQKNKFFHDVFVQIVDAKYEMVNGEEHVSVLSAREK